MSGATDRPRLRLLFVCVENSCRSQMAEALARMDGGGEIESFSAGSDASGLVNPDAIRVMAELGYDLGDHRSKAPDDLPPGPYDALVSMGCGDRCPTVPATHHEDWPVPDPKGLNLADFRAVRDDIRARIQRLIRELGTR